MAAANLCYSTRYRFEAEITGREVKEGKEGGEERAIGHKKNRVGEGTH